MKISDMKIRHLALGCECLILSILIAGPRNQLIAQKQVSFDKSDVKVAFIASRKDYRAGERITLTYWVENSGATPVYVHWSNSLVESNEAGFRLHVFDSSGRKIQQKGLFVDLFYDPQANVAEEIKKKWILLGPGSLYGKKSTSALRFPRPGRYRLQGTYFNYTLGRVTRAQRENIESLKLKILSGEYEAPPVWINITK